MITEVYRFELSDGSGIYTGYCESQAADKLQSKLYKAHNPSDGHENRPNTYADFYSADRDRIGYNALHGCPSVETLQEWFDGFVKDFIRCREIKLVKYKAKQVEISRSRLQCLFIPNGEGVVLKGKELDKFLN